MIVKKMFFVYAWLCLTVGVVLVGAALINTKAFVKRAQVANDVPPLPIAAAAPEQTIPTSLSAGEVKGMQIVTESADARPDLVASFLKRYNSPLKPYDHFGQIFVDLADTYQFDFRLLPAIAMQESSLCKKIPPDSFNCLGFGVHSRGTLKFESFEANFERAAKELKANYIEQGRTTPETIMAKYTPSSNGSWADSVNQWMREMEYDDRTLGRTLESSESVLEYVEATKSGATAN